MNSSSSCGRLRQWCSPTNGNCNGSNGNGGRMPQSRNSFGGGGGGGGGIRRNDDGGNSALNLMASSSSSRLVRVGNEGIVYHEKVVIAGSQGFILVQAERRRNPSKACEITRLKIKLTDLPNVNSIVFSEIIVNCSSSSGSGNINYQIVFLAVFETGEVVALDLSSRLSSTFSHSNDSSPANANNAEKVSFFDLAQSSVGKHLLDINESIESIIFFAKLEVHNSGMIDCATSIIHTLSLDENNDNKSCSRRSSCNNYYNNNLRLLFFVNDFTKYFYMTIKLDKKSPTVLRDGLTTSSTMTAARYPTVGEVCLKILIDQDRLKTMTYTRSYSNDNYKDDGEGINFDNNNNNNNNESIRLKSANYVCSSPFSIGICHAFSYETHLLEGGYMLIPDSVSLPFHSSCSSSNANSNPNPDRDKKGVPAEDNIDEDEDEDEDASVWRDCDNDVEQSLDDAPIDQRIAIKQNFEKMFEVAASNDIHHISVVYLMSLSSTSIPAGDVMFNTEPSLLSQTYCLSKLLEGLLSSSYDTDYNSASYSSWWIRNHCFCNFHDKLDSIRRYRGSEVSGGGSDGGDGGGGDRSSSRLRDIFAVLNQKTLCLEIYSFYFDIKSNSSPVVVSSTSEDNYVCEFNLTHLADLNLKIFSSCPPQQRSQKSSSLVCICNEYLVYFENLTIDIESDCNSISNSSPSSSSIVISLIAIDSMSIKSRLRIHGDEVLEFVKFNNCGNQCCSTSSGIDNAVADASCRLFFRTKCHALYELSICSSIIEEEEEEASWGNLRSSSAKPPVVTLQSSNSNINLSEEIKALNIVDDIHLTDTLTAILELKLADASFIKSMCSDFKQALSSLRKFAETTDNPSLFQLFISNVGLDIIEKVLLQNILVDRLKTFNKSSDILSKIDKYIMNNNDNTIFKCVFNCFFTVSLLTWIKLVGSFSDASGGTTWNSLFSILNLNFKINLNEAIEHLVIRAAAFGFASFDVWAICLSLIEANSVIFYKLVVDIAISCITTEKIAKCGQKASTEGVGDVGVSFMYVFDATSFTFSTTIPSKSIKSAGVDKSNPNFKRPNSFCLEELIYSLLQTPNTSELGNIHDSDESSKSSIKSTSESSSTCSPEAKIYLYNLILQDMIKTQACICSVEGSEKCASNPYLNCNYRILEVQRSICGVPMRLYKDIISSSRFLDFHQIVSLVLSCNLSIFIFSDILIARVQRGASSCYFMAALISKSANSLLSTLYLEGSSESENQKSMSQSIANLQYILISALILECNSSTSSSNLAFRENRALIFVDYSLKYLLPSFNSERSKLKALIIPAGNESSRSNGTCETRQNCDTKFRLSFSMDSIVDTVGNGVERDELLPFILSHLTQMVSRDKCLHIQRFIQIAKTKSDFVLLSVFKQLEYIETKNLPVVFDSHSSVDYAKLKLLYDAILHGLQSFNSLANDKTSRKTNLSSGLETSGQSAGFDSSNISGGVGDAFGSIFIDFAVKMLHSFLSQYLDIYMAHHKGELGIDSSSGIGSESDFKSHAEIKYALNILVSILVTIYRINQTYVLPFDSLFKNFEYAFIKAFEREKEDADGSEFRRTCLKMMSCHLVSRVVLMSESDYRTAVASIDNDNQLNRISVAMAHRSIGELHHSQPLHLQTRISTEIPSLDSILKTFSGRFLRLTMNSC